ncbi:MAG: LamG-like jellyroll fold domain-containing protein, partial [Sphingopyxis granuli]
DVTALPGFGGAVGDGGVSDAIGRGEGAPLDYSGLPGTVNHGWDVNRQKDLIVADSDALRPATLTLEAWVRSAEAVDDGDGGIIIFGGDPYQTILFKGSSTSWDDGYGLLRIGDTVRFYLNDWYDAYIEAPIESERWVHVAATYDGAVMRLYVDGLQVAERDFAEAIRHSGAPLVIGGGPQAYYPWNGAIDEVRVWDVARSAAQIAAAAQAPLSGGESGLVGYWRFDEADGWTAADSSPSGLPATGGAPATETRLYSFAAAKGEHWYFDVASQSGASLTVRVYRPDGTQLVAPAALADLNLANLPMDGTYLIAVEGVVGNGGAAAFSARMVKVADPTRAIAVDSLVTGRREPGERHTLTFTLTQPARLLFDSLSSRWDLHWTLTGPRGAEVNQRAFAYSDSLDLSSGLSSLLDLPAGTYSLIVDGSVGEAVDYAFRLIDTANAQAVAFDADVTGSFATGGTSNVYRFDAAAGDKVTLERLIDATSSDYSIGWRLFDPFGRQVTNANYLHGTSTVDLRVTGTYTLAIEQRVGAAPIGYGFRVNLTEHVALPDISGGALFQPGDTLSGTLVAGGEPGLHRFTVAGPTRLTFDSLTNDSGKTWTLLGPNGVEVSSRSFSASDGTSISGSAVIDLPVGGTYQLRVSGTAGAYSMRLLDLAAATPITPGGALVESRLLPARATDMYSFTGVAGETLYLDTQTALSSGSFRLIDPFGRLVVGPVGFADRELALPVDGTYVLLIEGRVANTAADDDYSFVLNRPRDPAPLDLTLGARIDGVLAAAGDVQRYRFQLSSERLLAFDSFTGSTTLTWRLKGPGIDYSASLRDADGAFQGTRPPLMLAAGEYELLIDGTGAAVGPYAFRLLDLAATATLLAADGATIAGALAPSSETDVYALDLSAGETIVFDAQTVPASSTIRLVDSFGNEVTGALTFADRTLVAAVTGRHYLLVEGRATNTAESSAYSFALIRPVDPAPRAITLGETVSTAIARPTEVNRFTFTLTETTRVYFDSLTNDSTIRWALRGATGTVSSADFYYSDSSEASGERVLTLAPGSYEIAVQADGYRTAPASFRLLDLADAAPVAFGQSVSGRLEPSSETDMYRFDAAAGERYYFQNLLGIGNATLRIIRPDGTQTRTPAGVADYEFTADQAGTYVVMIEGRVWDATARDYRFALHRATTAATAIALDGNVEQPSLLRPGKIGNALSMTTHEQILVDDPALDLREDLTIEFWLNPDRMTDSWTPLIYKGEGTDGRGYTLWYNSSGYVHLSSYRGTANDTLETASGSVPQGQWTHVAAVIERSTGQMRIYLNGVLVASRTNVPTAPHNGSAASPLYIGTGPEQNDSYQKLEGAIDELRIWDHGRSAEEILAGMDGVPSDTGGLVLRMDFDAIAGGTVRNQVSGADVPVLRDLAGLDGVIEGRLTTPGDTRTYSFTVAEPKMLLFDALHDNSQMTVTITGPGGVSAARNMRNGESHEYGSGNPLIEVGPGTYTVTVDGTGAATGAYAFRLIDVAAAPVLPQGSVATGRSSGSRDNAVWRIDAAAGDRLFIDLQQFGGSLGRASFRLFDPFGRQISGPVQVGDIDTGVLAYGGTYTLVMEMRAAVVNWPVDYRVAVYNMAQTAPVPITLEGPNPDAPTVVAGVDGNALKLRGVDYVELPDGPDVDLTRNLTIEGWFFLDRFTSSWMPVVSKGLGDTAPYRLAVNSSGQIWATVRDASGREDVTSASGVVPTGEWVHMAMVVDRDNRTLKLYVNGQEVASRQIRLNDNVDVADPFYIGHYDDETIYAPIEGAVDSFRLWGVARSAAEIAADMASAPPAGTPDLKIALDFDSTSLPAGALLRSTNPNGVTGRIATPGAENRYSFTLTQTTLALFDSLTNNSRLRWSLTGPDGDIIVDGRRFDQSDSFTFTGNPVLALAAGRYELTIDGIDDAVADYNFRLLDLANAAPLAMGSRVTASLTPSNATAIHRFSANAGESFFFDVLSVKSDVRWRLIDPNGNIVFNQQSMADIDGQLLALSGTYTLLIEGRIDQGLAAAYDFIIYPMAVQTAPLTIGAQISSTISQPGERDVYSFTLTERTRLVFDSLLYQGELNWSLTGPDGQIVSARRFDQSDGLNFTGNPVLDLAAGTYTLTIDGNRQFTGAYAFRLLDLAAAELLTANQGTTGNLGPQGRETAAYRFEATEGMRFGIDVLNSPNYNHRLRLIDPLGQVVFGPTSMQDSGLMTAAMAGTYTLLVEGYAAEGSNFSYSFLLDVAAQPPANGATGQDFDADGLPYVLVNHQGAAAQVLRDGENDFLRLTDALNNNPHNSVFFSATGSGRQDVVDVGFDFRIERRAGQATDPDGIAFAWLPVALYGAGGPGPTIPRSGSSGLEPNVAGALGIGFDSFANNGEVNANHVSIHYNGVKLTDIASPGLTLASGDWTHARILMTRTAGGTLLTVRLTAEGGTAIEVVTDYFIPGMELEAGRVALSASQGTSTGDQDVDNIAVAMTPAATAMPAVPFGEAVTGSIARTGAVERYSFTITQPTAVVFDPLTNNGNFRWQISGPSQTPAARQFTASDSLNFSDNPVMLLQPGTYSLAISAGTATGSYAFRLLDLAQAAALTPGEQQSVTLNPGNMTQLFHFDAAAGERLFFDYMSGATLPYWRLIDPRGNTVFTPRSIGSDSQVELTETGRYTLMVEGRIANAEPQTTAFRLVSMTDRDAALTVGATTQGTVPLPGDRMRYSFSLAQDALLLFDSLTGNGNFRWSLTGPQGTTIQDRTFANSDSQSRTDATPFLAAAGDYVLTVWANNDVTGDYAFRLLDLASASAIALDTVIDGLLEPANSTGLYNFVGEAGDKLFFDYLSSGPTGRWRLIDPQGRQIVYNNTGASSDMGPVVLTRSGTYTLVVEGHVTVAGASAPVQFKVSKLVDKVAPLTLGATHSGTVAQPQQEDVYRFTLAEGALLLVDPLTSDGSLVWTLTGPRGEVASKGFQSSDGASVGAANPVLVVPAGDYELRVRNNSTTARDYALRVLDLAAATPITPGLPVTGTLSPGSETEAFRFEGEAGERYYFDRQALSGGSAYWRLIAPNGRQLFSGYFNDVDSYVLPDTGTYTLLLEGYIGDVGSVYTYGFNVFENPETAPIPIPGLEVRPAPDLIPQGVTVSGEGAIQSGGTITVAWQTRNDGTLPATGTWSDRLILRNLDTGQIIGNFVIADNGGDLAPGASRQRQTTVSLPTGNAGVGRIVAIVTTDIANAVAEENASGSAETNNEASVEFQSILAPFIDLSVGQVAVEPVSGWKPGDTVTINWTTTNSGNRPTAGAFSERIVVRNASSGQQVLLATVAAAPIDAGASRSGSYSIVWPEGLIGHGQFSFTVTTDILDQVAEANDAGTGETNNAAALTITSAPDLVIRDMAIDATAPQAGDSITLSWTEANIGNAATLAGWNNRVLVQNITTGETLLDTAVASDMLLAAGAERARSFTFKLPDGARSVGSIRVTLYADQNAGGGGNAVREVADGRNAEGNNSAQLTTPVAARVYADLRVG